MTTSPEDRPDWLRRYQEEYLTLDEAGELEGITREAVRQRLNKMRVKPRRLRKLADSASAARFRREQKTSGRRSCKLGMSARLCRGIELAALAEQLRADSIGLEFLAGELQGSHCGARTASWPAIRPPSVLTGKPTFGGQGYLALAVLALGADPLVVVAGAKVGEPCCGVSEQVEDDDEDRAGDGG